MTVTAPDRGRESIPSTTAPDHSPDVELVPRPPTSPRIGRHPWLQILSTFIVFMNTWQVYLAMADSLPPSPPANRLPSRGFLLTSGAFQAYYELSLIPGQSSSDTSWISTTSAFLVFAVGIVAGPLYDRGFYKPLLVTGSLLQVFGFMMLSISTQYYQLFLSQAVCIGLGSGLVFTPSVSAAAACLPNPATRAKAMGLMACGSCVGGIIFPTMFRALVPRIGFPWTVRSIGFLILVLYLVSHLVLFDGRRKASRAPVIRRFFDTSSFTDLPFMLLSVASVFSATAFYIPLLYLPLFTKVRVPSISPDLTVDLLSILNGSSVIGRLAAGLAGAVFGPTETIAVSLVAGSTLLFCWIAVDTVAGTVVWTVFWGMISGILVTLPGAFIPLFCPSVAVIGSRTGTYWSWVGLGMLIGSPIGGAIYDVKSARSGYWRLQVFAGVFMMAAALLTVYPILHLRRGRGTASVRSD
ncbi:Major facilitator superfamily domain, general substrate transporter [Metarhizium album ARSEF 1941]|uniref:Major facilitator superfamily domain, general substrate transporter n=1 Tax=Metarhizium album (strain ARSEF 1941) TaxID=1081103 RepID=A0A0B2X9H7_METAS|nr:Major facilitator superfamily domain, general substrate transporter [Metarhizium album ARSEF 1941]KHO01971.1 Major facilitator superfamily domain, general substrate transporter [Metarhizium album ARSEF 1941]